MLEFAIILASESSGVIFEDRILPPQCQVVDVYYCDFYCFFRSACVDRTRLLYAAGLGLLLMREGLFRKMKQKLTEVGEPSDGR